jgi:hypothetical protein
MDNFIKHLGFFLLCGAVLVSVLLLSFLIAENFKVKRQ